MIWHQSLQGKAVDMVAPRHTDIDFFEIADVLSQINRYGGNSRKPVSVALHTLIACDAAPEQAKAHVLLHDAHEWIIGDIATPTAHALGAIAGETNDALRAGIAYAIAELKRRHDVAIHQAAGIDMPSPSMHAAIREADLVAMMTERRDFLCKPPKPWDVDATGLAPARKTYRWRPAPDVADELVARFQRHLPCFAGARPRALADA